jgi:hypothetical protein
MNTFYNTINLCGEDLKEANAQAMKQEDLIAAIFTANRGQKISPSQMKEIISRNYGHDWPLTSIRRGMTNLTLVSNGSILEKTDEKVPGIYGKPEHLWKLRSPDC